MSVYELNNFRPNAELNSISLDHKLNSKSPVIEIFSAMASGKDTSIFGEKANKAYSYLKTLGEKAMQGDGRARVELNAITTIALEAPLVKRLQLLSFMGNVINVGYNEEIRYKVYRLEGQKSNFQANQGDVVFNTAKWETRTMASQTISGGSAVNYREVATGNLDAVGVQQEQVITDMYNKIFYSVMNALYNGIKNSTGIKHFAENAGIVKASVDDMAKAMRRWGRVGFFGDYSVVSQLNDFTGFKADTTDTKTTQLSQAVMDEINRTGLLSTYKGTPIVEIPNTYDLTRLNDAGTNYETYLPEGLLFSLVSGEKSPLQVGYKGGLTSKSGFNIVSGDEVTRYDIEFASVVVPEYVPMIGLISDSNFKVNKLV